jgi:hypothetical protein
MFNKSFIDNFCPGYKGRDINWREALFASDGEQTEVRDDSHTEVKEQVIYHLALIDIRRIVETKNGSLGLGSPGVREGDLVSILNGFEVPVLLRTEGDHFFHVGTASVMGLMNGIAELLIQSGIRQCGLFEIN